MSRTSKDLLKKRRFHARISLGKNVKEEAKGHRRTMRQKDNLEITDGRTLKLKSADPWNHD